MWPLTLSLTPLFSPFSVIVTPFWLPSHCPPSSLSLKSCYFVYSLPAFTATLFFFFPPSPPHPPILPPAGCKMDSPQSESSEEEQKAEEKGAQGELQRGRRRSPTMHLASALILSWRRPFPFGDWSVFVCLTTKWFSVFYVLYIYIYMCEDTQYCSWSRLCLSCVLLPRV